MARIEDYEQIVDDLKVLVAAVAPGEPRRFAGLQKLVDEGVDVIGSVLPDFTLEPPVTEIEVIAFERRHGIRLPEEYRMFLLHCGRGGAGPYYGMFVLGQTDDGDGLKPWRERDGFVGTLAKPFPHAEPWNDLTGEPDDDLLNENETEYERQLDAFEARYFAELDGATPICHMGCALRFWLVVTGSETGNIWADHRVDHKGLFPVAGKNSNRVNFYQWYREWLDDELAKI